MSNNERVIGNFPRLCADSDDWLTERRRRYHPLLLVTTKRFSPEIIIKSRTRIIAQFIDDELASMTFDTKKLNVCHQVNKFELELPLLFHPFTFNTKEQISFQSYQIVSVFN